MPALYADCAWCGNTFANHRAGDHACALDYLPNGYPSRYDSAHSFTEMGKLTFKQVPLGSRVQAYTDQNWCIPLTCQITPPPTFGLIEATLVGPHVEGGLCLAWKKGETTAANAWQVNDGWRQEVPSLLSDHAYGRLVDEKDLLRCILQLGPLVGEMALTPIKKKSAGMSCAIATCRTFNLYAEPNHGKLYVCYSCKQAGLHKYMLPSN